MGQRNGKRRPSEGPSPQIPAQYIHIKKAQIVTNSLENVTLTGARVAGLHIGGGGPAAEPNLDHPVDVMFSGDVGPIHLDAEGRAETMIAAGPEASVARLTGRIRHRPGFLDPTNRCVCGFNAWDHQTTCTKCGRELSAAKWRCDG